MARDVQTATAADDTGDCDHCNGTGRIMVGEQPTADGTGVKPRYEPCRECGGDD